LTGNLANTADAGFEDLYGSAGNTSTAGPHAAARRGAAGRRGREHRRVAGAAMRDRANAKKFTFLSNFRAASVFESIRQKLEEIAMSQVSSSGMTS